MPQLPESIWRRRLDSEFEEMSASGTRFQSNQEHTEYRIFLEGGSLWRDHGVIKKRSAHEVLVRLKREYPYPGGIDVVWLTPIFHPNIRESDGKVCILLVNDWAETQTVKSVVDALKQLLDNPNPASPLNKEAAEYLVKHPEEFGLTPVEKHNRPHVVA